ncbi:MAG: NAD(P)/FAD-dependent oxidoreductase [Myxococcota bacterium]
MTVVVGAGVGGLCAALALRRAGRQVTVFEARPTPGGLAGSFEAGGRLHDGGPYILLDAPGLRWAMGELGLRLDDEVELIRLEEPYQVERADGSVVRVFHDLDRTADGIDADHRGAGARYRAFVHEMRARYTRLAPLQRSAFGGPSGLLGGGRWRDTAFLLRSLGDVLTRAGLPDPVRDAVGIWTHIAAQPLDRAPAPLALVPAVVHSEGAFTVRGGLGRLIDALVRAAERAGVQLVYDSPVTRIVRDGRRVLGVETGGRRVGADLVVSDAPGITTLARLVDPPDAVLAQALEELPLQSPGVAAYLHADVGPEVPFLRFRLDGGGCRGLLSPGAVDPERRGTARLLAPVAHDWAQRVGPEGQRTHLDALLAEPWWQTGLDRIEVVARRIPVEWGRAFHLWRDSMNPAMTAAFMRRGRLPHRAPIADNLWLCGSSTHPGQWVSFCAISGVLAARAATAR